MSRLTSAATKESFFNLPAFAYSASSAVNRLFQCHSRFVPVRVIRIVSDQDRLGLDSHAKGAKDAKNESNL